MNYNTFFNGLEEIYAIFGKKPPEERIIEVAYKRVKDLPDDFMAYAVRHFEDQESLPKNLGYHMLRNLWPDYLDKNPELKSRHDTACCPLCCPDMPGFRRVWRKIVVFGNETAYRPEIVRCTCGNAPNPGNEPILNDRQLLERGIWLTCPYHFRQEDLPPKWRRVIGHDEEPRSSHVYELERCNVL